MSSEIRRGFFSALPLMMGFIPLAMILGAQCSQIGISNLGSYLMTALNFAGGSEFAAIGLWAAVPPFLLIAFTTFCINSRHIVMGAALAPYIRQESTLRIMLIYFLMCDETWSLSMQDIQRRAQENRTPFSFGYYLGVGLSLWSMWSISTFCGSLVGRILGDLSQWGFAMALPATFIGLSISLRPRKDLLLYIPVTCSFILSGACSVFWDPKYAVACGAFGGLFCAYLVQIYKEKHGLVAAETHNTEKAASTATQNTADASADPNTANAAAPANTANVANVADTTASVATAKP